MLTNDDVRASYPGCHGEKEELWNFKNICCLRDGASVCPSRRNK